MSHVNLQFHWLKFFWWVLNGQPELVTQPNVPTQVETVCLGPSAEQCSVAIPPNRAISRSIECISSPCQTHTSQGDATSSSGRHIRRGAGGGRRRGEGAKEEEEEVEEEEKEQQRRREGKKKMQGW
ncbi:MAG: hypothetical protein FRX49_00178 [Trebouxia sp. A1-2]|nr:MAG: hypothetical protein FRX49_00178 [Trebouxia sp. A1-2]